MKLVLIFGEGPQNEVELPPGTACRDLFETLQKAIVEGRVAHVFDPGSGAFFLVDGRRLSLAYLEE